MDEDPLTYGDDAVVTAYLPEIEEAVVRDVADNKADFIGVPRQHDVRASRRVLDGDDVAKYVCGYGVGVRANEFAVDLLHLLFVAGGTWSVHQFF